jgi:hypothetical protein
VRPLNSSVPGFKETIHAAVVIEVFKFELISSSYSLYFPIYLDNL